MSAISTELPPRYLRTKEAAQFLSLSARTPFHPSPHESLK